MFDCPQDIAASLIGSAANGSAVDVSAEYASFDAVTSTKAFVEAAKSYRLSGNNRIQSSEWGFCFCLTLINVLCFTYMGFVNPVSIIQKKSLH